MSKHIDRIYAELGSALCRGESVVRVAESDVNFSLGKSVSVAFSEESDDSLMIRSVIMPMPAYMNQGHVVWLLGRDFRGGPIAPFAICCDKSDGLVIWARLRFTDLKRAQLRKILNHLGVEVDLIREKLQDAVLKPVNAERTSGSGFQFGGSLLPSSDPRILQPLQGVHGTLSVVPMIEAQEYGLFFEREIEVFRNGAHRKEMGRSLLASHANGYSCRGLAERIVAAWENPSDTLTDKAMEQFDYILRCGGLGMQRESIMEIVRQTRG